MDSIRSGNHQLLKLEFNRSMLAYRKEAARLEGKPDFRIGLDYTFIGSGENNLVGTDAFVFPVVGFSIPLYREKYKAMIREVAYLETANEEASRNKVNGLETLLERIWKDYLDAKRRIGLNEEQMDLAERSLELLQSEYSTANREFEEILRMERKLLQYKLEFEKAKSDKQAAIAFLYYLMGK